MCRCLWEIDTRETTMGKMYEERQSSYVLSDRRKVSLAIAFSCSFIPIFQPTISC